MDEDLFLYHGGLPSDFDFSQLNPFRIAEKQNKAGTNYGGFYMTEHPDMANHYAKQSDGSVHQFRISKNANIQDYPSNVERIDVGTLRKLYEQGVDVLRGKNAARNTEYVLVNPKAINNPRTVDTSLFGDRVTGPMGHLVSKPLDKSILDKLKMPILGAFGTVGQIMDGADLFGKLQRGYNPYDPNIT